MRLRLSAAVATAITISAGFLTLLGLLVGDDLGLLSDLVEQAFLSEVADVFLQWVAIAVALTVLIGIVNLMVVHLRRVGGRAPGAINSVALAASFLVVVITYVAERDTSMVLLETVQISVESALAGLLFFALVFGAYRIMRRRVSWTGAVFVAMVLIVLAGALPLSQADRMNELSTWLFEVPVSGGARGILLGIALATVVAGMRVLIGQDRSYRE